MAEINTGGEGKGKHKKKGSKKMSTRVDLTPMVDLAFLLVTFFMLTTTFSKPQTMEINMPVKEDNPDSLMAVKASKAITVILGEDHKIFYWYPGLIDENTKVESTNFSKDGIRKILLMKNKEIKDLTVLIKPMRISKYKDVVDILDEMNVTGVKRYSLVDITQEDINLVSNM